MNIVESVRSLGYDGIKKIFDKLGYRFYDSGKYNINVFGVRKKNPVSNKFDDALCYAFGTAGTGGFGISSEGFGIYANSHMIEYTIAIGMLAFGINFNLYFMISTF